MKKLTADRCKRQIEEWQRMMSVSDVAVMVELNLQAYLIALPILEQQERGDGWIEWRGGASGSCPVAYTTLVEVQSRSGHVAEDCAEAFEWCHEADDDDIIAYRTIPEQPTNQNGEQ